MLGLLPAVSNAAPLGGARLCARILAETEWDRIEADTLVKITSQQQARIVVLSSHYAVLRRDTGEDTLVDFTQNSFEDLGSTAKRKKITYAKSAWPLKVDLEELALDQAQASSTFGKTRSTESKRRLFDGLVKANQSLFEKLNETSLITEQDLSAINRLVALDPSGRPIRWSGFVRGRVRRVKGETLDFRVSQAWNEGHMFLAARRVPIALKDWLSRVNQIDRKTGLLDVLKLYQEFIAIHPFGNGNGRTGRVLLAYMLASAGYHPVLGHSELLGSILFKNEDEIGIEFSNSF